MKLVSTDLEKIFVTETNADANNHQNLSVYLERSIDISFYKTPLEAVEKVQGLE